MRTHTHACTEMASRMRPQMTEHRQAREDTQLCCPQPPTMWSPRKHPHARPIPRPSCSGTVPLCHLLLPSSLSLGPQQNPQRTLLRTTLPREVASPASDTGSCRSKEGDGGSSQHDTNLYPAASSQLESPPPQNVTNLLTAGARRPATSPAGVHWPNGPLRLDTHLTYPPTGP